MTRLPRWLSGWWQGPPPSSPRQPAILPPRPANVPRRYLPLYNYLEHRYASTVVLTLVQMEALIDGDLPPIAHSDARWWTEDALPADRHSDAWTMARRTAHANLPARVVSFERWT